MDYVLYILSGLLITAGIIGSILPVLPGPIVGYAGLVLLYFTGNHPFTITFLVVFAILTLIVSVIDYIIPIYGTKKFHGSKYGMWGSTIGVFAGMFFFPFGIIAGPFIGALVGELITGKGLKIAFSSAFGSFVGFLAGTGLKLILTVSMGFYYGKIIC